MVHGCKLILLLGILTASLNSQSLENDSNDIVTIQDLRFMLLTVKEQNRRLVQQNTQLQRVWSAMQGMCDALLNITDRSTESTMHILEEPLNIATVETSGGKSESDDVTISVTYKAPTNHSTEWRIRRDSGSTEGTSGYNATDGSGMNTFKSEVTATIPSTLTQVSFILRKENETIRIDINLSNITIPNNTQIQHLQPAPSNYLNVDTVYSAPKDTDLNITVGVNDTLDMFLMANFIGINITETSQTSFQLTSITDEYYAISVIRRDFGFLVIIPEPYVQFGGLLMLNTKHYHLRTDLIETYSHGVVIKILGSESNSVVAKDAIGMFPFEGEVIAIPPTRRLYCAAMGNPRPHVSILKLSKKGKTELKTETVIDNSIIHGVVHTLKMDSYGTISPNGPTRATNKKANKGGTYICRATRANHVIEKLAEVVVLEKAYFDEDRTGVLKNTSSKVVFSCKARGTPTPSLQMTLMEEYGEDVFKSESRLLVARRDITPNFARITLSLYPSKAEEHKVIHTVYCRATQRDWELSYEVVRKIELFPGMDKFNGSLIDSHYNRSEMYYHRQVVDGIVINNDLFYIYQIDNK